MSNKNSTTVTDPVFLVRAIIACIRSKGRMAVTFKKSSFADPDDIPDSKTLQGPIEYISVSAGRYGCIDITVYDEETTCRTGRFNGSKDEDFARLFEEVYDHIRQASDPEPDEWLEAFAKTPCNPLKAWLVDRIKNIRHMYTGGIRVPETWWDDMGFEYDTLTVLDINGKETVGLVDSANGINNPTYCPVENLTTVQLLRNYRFLIRRLADAIIDDFDAVTGDTDTTGLWACDAVENLILARDVSRLTEHEALCSDIHEALRVFREKGMATFAREGDIDSPMPYILHRDHFLGHSIEGVTEFRGGLMAGTECRSGAIRVEAATGRMVDSTAPETIAFNPLGSDGTPEPVEILVTPTDIVLGEGGEYASLPEESIAALAEMLASIEE